MRRVAPKITLSDAEREILLDIVKGHSSRKDHVRRARMILYCAKGVENSIAGQALNESRELVGKWRNRWAKAAIALEKIQIGDDKTITLKSKICEILSDAPRSGGPTKFTDEQLCQIYAVATEKPEESDIPLSHWSLKSLSTEVVKRGIVASISTSQLNFFLKSEAAQAAQSPRMDSHSNKRSRSI